MNSLVIFSDLDGTLLDHYDYNFDAAVPTLRKLEKLNIPCVINTSKTHAELIKLQQALELDTPFIIENGAAVYIPKNYPLKHAEEVENLEHFYRKALGPSRHDILALLQPLKQEFKFTGFADLTPEGLIEVTQLSQESAELALQREFTEPLIWQDSEDALERFKQKLAHHGLQTQKGGRFVHVMGEQCDKAIAMQWLAQCYQQHYGQAVTTMALGDGGNDVGMISQADIGVVIHSPAHNSPAVPNKDDVYFTKGFGPVGWTEAVEQVLTNMGINQ